MSASLLREAAALMRERAEAATAGPWHDVQMGSEGSIVLNDGLTVRDSRKPATCREFADAEHIASWHPAVAHAVADWLESVARAERHEINGADISNALAVARAYINDEVPNV